MTAAAFQACFTDWRLIKGRKVVQIVLEVPLEGADTAYHALGGMPDPGKSVWCAVARLSDAGNKPPASDGEAGPQPQQRNAASASRLTRQAGIACNDPVFRAFLREKEMLSTVDDAEEVATAVRLICGCKSRKEIIPGTPTGDKWEDLYSQFLAWREVE